MSSLAKTIIYGTPLQVQQMITDGATINEIDEYGYTPLIQTVIVDDIQKAKVILNAGADIQFTDLTGRSALHWATENNNIEIAKLLLEKGADTNAYSRAGQPALTMPYLRGHDNMKKLLYRFGAKLSFAQDFTNAKLLGHRYDLQGRVDIVTPDSTFIEVELEGFYLEFSLAIVEKSLRDFKTNFAGKHLRKYFDKIQIIIDALRNATLLMKYQHYLVDVKENEKMIDQLLGFSPLLIPTVYTGHAISLIVFGNILIRCDRGQFGRDNGPIIFYQVGNKNRLNSDFMKNILYHRQYKATIDEELIRHLDLEPIDYLNVSLQISGNCSWANCEAVLPAMLYMLLLQQKIPAEKAKAEALGVFDEWINWDKGRALSYCIENFYRASPTRKASKAALLASIIFQTYDFENEEHRHAAEQIFILFSEYPEYNYILKAYVEVFQYDRDNPMFKNYMKFVDYFEVQY